MKTALTKMVLLALCLLLSGVTPALASPDPAKIIDQYAGDTSIYTLRASDVPVNVLFLIDNSHSAANIASGEKFVPGGEYTPETYAPDAVYMADQQGDFPLNSKVLDFYTDFTCATTLDDGTTVESFVETSLETFGTYSATGTRDVPIIKSGACRTAPKGETYALGRYLNYLNAEPPNPPIVEYRGDYYAAVKTHVSTFRNPPGSTLGADLWELLATPPADLSIVTPWRPFRFYNVTGLPQIELIHNAIRLVTGGYRKKGVKFGAMSFNDNNKGGKIIYPISDLSDDATFDAFMTALPQDPETDLLSSQTARPLLGTMLDALAYYKGVDTLPVGGDANGYDDPITIRCQPNFIILITNGLTNESMGSSDLTPLQGMRIFDGDGNEIGAPCGDVDEDDDVFEATPCGTQSPAYFEYLDDMAMWMRHTDLIDDATMEDDQSIITGTVLAFTSNVPLVASAGEQGGLGFRQANNANELADKLQEMLENIVRRAQSSFVAPVVPASPENRVRSGKRIYLGFFKPMTQEMWHGNLKKYILNSSGDILALDANGDEVPYDTASSYSLWSAAEPDVGSVEKGGVGEKLVARAAANSRKIYTFAGSSIDLTHSSNAFQPDNSSALASLMGFDSLDPELDKTINFVRGRNTLDDGRTLPRDWVLGDILHSKPLIFNYKQYDFNLTNEAEGPPGDDWSDACAVADLSDGATDCNKTMIFVGANDGLLHAFSDYNGEELWAFAPTDLLKYTKELDEVAHSYFVDGSASIYSYDHNLNGDYTDAGDYVILVFGTRRGGGLHQLDPSASRGTYYGLDITVPSSPKFLFALSSDRLTRYNGTTIETITTAAALPKEMGETWSQPFIRPIVINGTYTVALFFGAGYDNNEDMRWGSTQSFPLDAGNVDVSETLVIDNPTDEYNLPTSNNALNEYYADLGCASGATGAACGQVNPRGRGLYIYELTREGNTPSERVFTNTGDKIWAYTHGDHHSTATNHVVDNTMTFSFPADVKVLDANKDGKYDRVYAADTGGRVWRFLIGDANNDGTNLVSEWSGKMVFNANPGSDSTNGRKFFYAPDYNIVDSNLVHLFVSSGDRAHPLNYKDHGLTDGAVLDRIYMIKDYLDDQSATPPTALTEDHLLDFTSNELEDPTTTEARRIELEAMLANEPWDTTVPGTYGWYIKLNAKPGEKALSPPLELVGYLMQTTYAPNTNITDPCEAGNQGSARFYALSALSGTAALDLDGDGDVDADDRDVDVGGGIPPEVTPIVTDEGIKVIMVVESTNDPILDGADGGSTEDPGVEMKGFDLTEIDTIVPVYWMQW